MKIGFLITARLKSSRLPYKIIKDLNGKTVIERIIDRVKEVKGISDIVICTSSVPQDRPLVDIAVKNGIYYFNGDADDVMKRLLDAAKFFGLDYFLGITAENPLITIRYSGEIVKEIKKGHYDYVKIKGLPLGSATYGVKTKALEAACRVKTIIDTEIWGYLIDRPEVFNVKTITAKGKLNKPSLRFTIDYEKDYELISSLYSKIPFEKVIDLEDVMDYLDKHPDLAKINQGCEQIYLENCVKKEIDSVYNERIEEIKKIKEEDYKS